MASSILTQILSLINLGQSLPQAVETVVPGADVTYWQRQIARQDAPKQAKPKRKSSKRSYTPKPSKKSQYARMQSVLARSTAELVERVNGGEPRFVNGNLEVW